VIKEDGSFRPSLCPTHSAVRLVPRPCGGSFSRSTSRHADEYYSHIPTSDNQVLCAIQFLRPPFHSVRRCWPKRPCSSLAGPKALARRAAASLSSRSFLGIALSSSAVFPPDSAGILPSAYLASPKAPHPCGAGVALDPPIKRISVARHPCLSASPRSHERRIPAAREALSSPLEVDYKTRILREVSHPSPVARLPCRARYTHSPRMPSDPPSRVTTSRC